MQPGVALTLALVSGGLAVALVAADSVWSLELAIESQDAQGQWRPVARSQDLYRSDPFFSPEDCAGPSLRLVVDNNKPLPETVRVRFWYTNATGATHTFEDETLRLDAFGIQTFEATVPPEAFEQQPTRDDQPKPVVPQVHVNAQADQQYIGVCVQQEA